MKRFLFPRCIAHRGAPLVAPENTLPALTTAIQAGGRYIESDIQLASTGEACMFHDDSLDRTSNGIGLFEEQPWSLLSELDAGQWFDDRYVGVRIPLLSDWLQCAAENGVGLNLEIKPTQQIEAVVDTTLAMINQHWSEALPPIIISSKSEAVLKCCADKSRCADKAPAIARAWVSPEWEGSWLVTLQSIGCVSWHLDHRLLTQKRVQSVRSAVIMKHTRLACGSQLNI